MGLDVNGANMSGCPGKKEKNPWSVRSAKVLTGINLEGTKQIILFGGIFVPCFVLDFTFQKIGFNSLYSKMGSFILFVAFLDTLTTYLFLSLKGTEGNFLPSFLMKKIGIGKALTVLYLILASAILSTLYQKNLVGLIGWGVIVTGVAIWNILYSLRLLKSSSY